MTLSTLALAAVLAAASPVAPRFGGLPLETIRFDIGEARSLAQPPDGSNPYLADPAKLLQETLAILDGSRDSLLHLETIRRAVLYAQNLDGENEYGVARTLELKLVDRALRAALSGEGDALRWLDAGFASIAVEQHHLGYDGAGQAYVEKAATLAPTDGGVRLLAALVVVVFGPNGRQHAHFEAALRAASDGAALRRTLEALPVHFRPPARDTRKPGDTTRSHLLTV